MKRAIKERPRVAAAAVLGAAALVLIGVVLGVLIAGASSGAATTTRLRLASAESTAHDAARRLRVAEADLNARRDVLHRSEQQSRKLARRNAELKLALRKARLAAQSDRGRQLTRSSRDR
jgi:hypothetical protein